MPEVVAARTVLEAVLAQVDPTEGLWGLVESGWSARWCPELDALAMEQDPIHRHKDVLAHTIAVVAKAPPQVRVRLAALFHDIAKPASRRVRNGKVTFHHHEAKGARITAARLTALDVAPDLVADVAKLVELSGRFHGYADGWTDAAVRRYARDAGHLLGDLNALVRSDCTTRHEHKVRALHDQVDDLEQRIRALADEERARSTPPLLDGDAIMRILGIGPGPDVGRAMREVDRLVAASPSISPDGATSALRAWARTALVNRG